MNGIDPKWVFYLGILVTIETAIGQGSVKLTNLVPDSWVPLITGWCTLLAFVGNVIMTALAGYSSKQAGPLVKPVVILAVVVASLFAFTGEARAQGKPRLAPPAVTGDLQKDLHTDAQNLGLIPPSLQVTPTGNIAKDLKTLWDKIVAANNTDLAYASKLAASANTGGAMVRKQCWDAIIAVNNQANGLNLKDANGALIPRPDPHLFTDVETLAEVVDNLSPTGPLFTSCAGAAQLAKTNVLTFINAAVTGAAGIAAMPVIPGL